MTHTIREQILDLLIGPTLDPFEMQQRMSVLFFDKILPELDKIFDSLSDEDIVVSIDLLEIDLGTVAASDLDNDDGIRKLLAVIRDQVYAKIRPHDEYPGGAYTTQSRSLSVFGQWIYFMRTGHLPWNIAAPGKEWHQGVLETLADDYHSADELRALIVKHPAVLERIVFQHSIAFLVSLLELLTAKNQAGLPESILEMWHLIQAMKDKMPTALTGVSLQRLSHLLWKDVLRVVTASSANWTTDNIMRNVVSSYINGRQAHDIISARNITEIPNRIIPILADLASNAPIKEVPSTNTTAGEAPGTIKPPAGPPIDEVLSGEGMVNPETGALVPTSGNEKDISSESNTTDKPVSKIDEEGLFVKAAGAVLLHPFLRRFFHNIGLTRNDRFIDDDSQVKAIYLVHYLATGSASAAEYDLVMSKLLCGFLLENAVDTGVELNENELKEADDLLSDIIMQWEILKNTSPSGLREGFLQRPGKLYTSNERLHVLVETNSIDVLLDYLPWNLSIVKLPWMVQSLQVDWR